MRITHSLLILSLLAGQAAANARTLQEQQSAAESLLGAGTVKIELPGKLKAPGLNTERTISVFASPAGDRYAVTASADSWPAVLGYGSGSLSGNLPPQLEWLLSYYQALAAQGAEAPFRAAATTEIELDVPFWGQGAPWNELCPTDYTGCVATSAAQLLKYSHSSLPPVGSHAYTFSALPPAAKKP